MMRIATTVLAGLALAVTGCSSNDGDGNDDTAGPPAPAASYSVSVTAVDVVNVDSGETLPVDGFPAAGGSVTIE
jgi:hypothetical protein